MRIIDVSAPLREGMPVWPGDTPFGRRERTSIERGDGVGVRDGVLEERLQQVGGTPYLAQLTDSIPAVAHVAAHARVVRESYAPIRSIVC